jgi:hypothetical protein
VLTIARAIVRQGPIEPALALIAERPPAPATLSRAAVELISETLIHGTILFLSRVGGWRTERWLRSGRPVAGRLWERTAPADMPLVFSRRSLDWLLWLATARPNDEPSMGDSDRRGGTAADQLLVFLTFDALRDSDFHAALRFKPIVAGNALVRLAFPEDFVSATVETDFAPWFEGLGAVVLEALNPWLAQRWIDLEVRKAQVGDWPALAAIGREQDQVLAAFGSAAETAGRSDLLRFILEAARAVLVPDATPETFFGGLQAGGPARLADRLDVQRQALALPRHVLRLRDAERRCRGIGYLDEGYAAAQFRLSEWERLDGEALAQRAAALLQAIEPLKTAANTAAGGES